MLRLPDRRYDTLGRVALAMCVLGVVVGIAVAIYAISHPRDLSLRDAAQTTLAIELLAGFMGGLARRSSYGKSALVIAIVLALGAWAFKG